MVNHILTVFLNFFKLTLRQFGHNTDLGISSFKISYLFYYTIEIFLRVTVSKYL